MARAIVRLAAGLALFAAALVASAMPAHYIVIREDAAGNLSVVHRSVVQLDAIPRVEPSNDWDGHGSRLERRLSVRAVKAGEVLYQTDVVTARHLRHEFTEGMDLGDHARHFELRERAYVLRLPVFEAGVRALVTRPRTGASPHGLPKQDEVALEIDLAAPAPMAKAAEGDLITISETGPSANRLDLLFLGDGYTAAERDKFRADVESLLDGFFSRSPYREYRPMFNVRALFVASNESGADKPYCPETPSAPVIEVDTAFDATYCLNGIRRLIGVDPWKVYAALQAAPGFDRTVVLVNDTEYGGAGGQITTSLHPLAIDILQHEFGHGFTRLADEYTSPYPGYPPCSDAPGTTSPCEVNVSDRLSPLKWEAWLEPGVPIPSGTAGFADPRAAGAWEGARYLYTGMYRQCFNGMMRTTSTEFCLVDSEAFVLRLYGANWGVPSTGIAAIEPGTRSPEGDSLAAPGGSPVALAARVVAPTTGVLAEWRVDGGLVKSERLQSLAEARFTYTALSGTHTVALTVTDDSLALLLPRAWSTSWQVTGTAVDRLAAAPEALAFGAQVVDTVSQPLRVTLSNTGDGSLTPAIGVTGPFEATHACGSLPPGGSCAVDVIFHPTAVGPASGTLTATGGSAAATVSLSGTGEAAPVARLAVSPEALAFGGQSMNTTSPLQRVTLSNGGNTSLTPAIAVTAGFHASHGCGALAPGETCTVDVTFTPSTEGAVDGTLTASAPGASVVVVLSGSGERSLVTHYYRSILRRAPEAAGHDYWTGEAARVAALGANVNETWFTMAMAFYGSAEYAALARDAGGYVDDLYATFFNRAADSGGRTYWMGQLSQGVLREVLLAGFMFSPEFADFTRAIFGETAARAEVDVVMDFYRGLLGRLPDGAGFDYWLGRFRAAQCAGGPAVNAEVDSISSLFVSSPEYAARGRTTERFVGDLYNAFLRRGGDADGVRFWIEELDSGRLGRDAARAAFVSTPEFQARVEAILRQGCLR